MKNIIIVEGKEKYCFSNIEEAVKKFLDNNFYNLSEEEKYKTIRRKTVMNANLRKIPIVDLKKSEVIENIANKQYIIYDEEIFLLSLAKNNDIVIYEKQDANLFANNIDKQNLEKVSKEYIRVNGCVNCLIENKLKSIKL